MNKKKEVFLLVFLVVLFLGINYRFIDNNVIEFLEESDTVLVKRVIDGDTIVVDNDTHVRLLGVNTPEKGEKYYNEAKEFLNNLTLNQTVKLEYIGDKYDKYGRTLAYVILDRKNINTEQVRNGFANLYIYNNDKYTIELKQAWNECIQTNKNLCEKSTDKCSNCIKLKGLDVKTQKVILHNNCSFECDLTGWNMKDEGRKKFVFSNFILKGNGQISIVVGNKTNSESVLYWTRGDYVWTSTGDTLFLRDEKGGLILWKEINR